MLGNGQSGGACSAKKLSAGGQEFRYREPVSVGGRVDKAMSEYRYPCTRGCLRGHPTPRCPYLTNWDPPTMLELQQQVHHLQRIRIDPRVPIHYPGIDRPPSSFRWWWIPVGVVVFIALVILI